MKNFSLIVVGLFLSVVLLTTGFFVGSLLEDGQIARLKTEADDYFKKWEESNDGWRRTLDSQQEGFERENYWKDLLQKEEKKTKLMEEFLDFSRIEEYENRAKTLELDIAGQL